METKARQTLLPREVAEQYRVDPKTVTRWCAAGYFGPEAGQEGSRGIWFRTGGGHIRFNAAKLHEFREAQG